MQRTYVVAARYGGVGRSRLVEGAFGAQHDDGVEASVHLSDAVKVRLRDLYGGYLPVSNGLRYGLGG